jgi:tripartite-type tricarboxylate transporter receptor subunit TctC
MTLRIRDVLAGALFALCSTAVQPAEKTDFPTKPIRWIVPFPPGGSNDILSRYIGAKLSERVREQVVIDNRGGANGIIGADLAAHAAPDGYTLLMVSTSWVMNAAVRSSLPYDVEKSFDPIASFGSSPNCIVIHPGAFKTLKELVERAKANPAKIFYASTGVGGFNHFGGELFKKVTGVNMLMVPYRGGGPAMTDVMAGQVPVMFSSVTQVLPHVRSGKLNVLAVGSAKRSVALPDVPTVAESGYPGYEVAVWWGVVGPTGIASALQEKIRREFLAVLNDPETTKRLVADSAEPLNLTPAEFRKFIHEEVKKWSTVAKQANIHVQ